MVKSHTFGLHTFVFKALWYMGHLKTRLIPDLKPSQNVSMHSLFKPCKFREKNKGSIFAGDQNVLYNA